MSDHPPTDDHSEDDLEVLAALDALEGRGVRPRSEVDTDEALVEEFEAAAGALFAAWPRSGDAPAPSPGFQSRLERFVLSQVADDLSGEDPPTEIPVHGGRPIDPEAFEQDEPSHLRAHPANATPAPRWGLVAAAGWLVAAGLLAFVLLGSRDQGGAAPSLEDQFDAFVAAGHPVGAWTSTASDPGISGGVTWDDQGNGGFMKISGLKVNDPSVEQYQLWIFRTTDTEKELHPVDGGVFDVASTGEVIVPIDAKLNVGHASLFAVTIEQPGGVVVSDRTRLPILAKRAI